VVAQAGNRASWRSWGKAEIKIGPEHRGVSAMPATDVSRSSRPVRILFSVRQVYRCVCKAPLRRLILKPGIAFSSDVFAKEVQKGFYLWCKA